MSMIIKQKVFVLVVIISFFLSSCGQEVQFNHKNEIENSEEVEKAVISAQPENPISRYYGGLHVVRNSRLITYDIKTYYEDEIAHGKIEFVFSEFGEELSFQTLEYEIGYFWPETVRQGLLVDDVNGDGNEDIILELGIRGKAGHSICYVYDEATARYKAVDKFDELLNPKWYPELNVIIASLDNLNGYEKYQICESTLKSVGKIEYSIINDGADAIVSEIEYSGGGSVEKQWNTQEEKRNIQSRWGDEINQRMRFDY